MSRKIYFAGSIAGGRQDADLYGRIVAKLQEYGEVLSEIVGTPNVGKDEHTLDLNGHQRIHDQDLEWLTQCDYMVAEVTQPSLGVGYEIGRAVSFEKKILCLFKPDSDKRLSSMIQGAHNGSTFIVRKYQESEVPSILQQFFC